MGIFPVVLRIPGNPDQPHRLLPASPGERPERHARQLYLKEANA